MIVFLVDEFVDVFWSRHGLAKLNHRLGLFLVLF